MQRLFHVVIRKLLRRGVEKRLGTSGADAVKAHRFFSSVDWRMVEEKRYPPPHIPSFSNKSDATDVSQFDPRFTSRTPRESEVGHSEIDKYLLKLCSMINFHSTSTSALFIHSCLPFQIKAPPSTEAKASELYFADFDYVSPDSHADSNGHHEANGHPIAITKESSTVFLDLDPVDDGDEEEDDALTLNIDELHIRQHGD